MPKQKKKVSKKDEMPKAVKTDYNKVLKQLFIGGGIVVALVIVVIWFFSSLTSFDYHAVSFKTVKEGTLVFYQTTFPIQYNGSRADYSIYLRNDPRKLEKEVPFNGTLDLRKMMVLNLTQDFNCDGDGIIAVGNFLKLQIFGIKIIKDLNATCSAGGEYNYVSVVEGTETRIDQIGPACYKITVGNCGILKGTERFMDESFVRLQSMKK